MIEELVEIAKKDKRVNIDFTINNRIHLFSAMDPKNKKIIIYIHGLGGNKNWITRFYKDLLDNGYNCYSLDLTSNGEDGNDFKKFNLNNCISYLKDTINYIKDKHKDSEIYLFGSADFELSNPLIAFLRFSSSAIILSSSFLKAPLIVLPSYIFLLSVVSGLYPLIYRVSVPA